MKRFLLAICLVGAGIFANAQVVLNEIHPNPTSFSDPAKNRNEYVELFNTTSREVPLDGYTLVSYDNNKHTAWVYQLPQVSIAANGFLVLTGSTTQPLMVKYGSGGSNNTQTYTGSNIISWNVTNGHSSLKKYTKSGNSLAFTADGPTPDFLPIAQGNSATTALFLFNGNTLVNALVTNNGTHLPADFGGLTAPLTFTTGSCTISLNFSALAANKAEIVQNLNAAPGSDHGYYRITDGLCGSWDKLVGSSWSPGVTNGDDISAVTVAALTASADCGSDRSSQTSWFVTVTVTNAAYTAAPYYVYDDVNHDKKGSANEIVMSGSISNTDQYRVPTFTATRNNDIIVKVSSSSGCIAAEKRYAIECDQLPVHFTTFSATRNKGTVNLKWSTASEQANSGFNVQRNTGSGWKTIAFVFSQADGGNSSTVLNYEYKDANTERGVTQYRLQQVDIDNKATFSDTRSVMGLAQAAKIMIFPNPSEDGTVTVLFQTPSVREVVITDVTGRIIRQYREVTGSSLQIAHLPTGFFAVKVVDRTTGETGVEKIIVK